MTFLDSAEAINLIDSSYVQARQDYAYASLTGAPTNVSQFANDAGYLTAATTVDSAEVQSIIDSDFAQRTTDELAEGSSNLYYTTARADSDFDIRLITKTTTDIAEGDNLYYTTARADSDFDSRLSGKSTDDLSEGLNQYYTTVRHNTDTLLQVDSAYVQLRQARFADSAWVTSQIDALIGGAPGTLDTLSEIAAALNNDDSAYTTLVNLINAKSDFDSNNAIGLIDSAYVQLRQIAQDFAYSSLTGVPDIPAIVRANSLDSAEAQDIIDSNFQNLNQSIIPVANATYDLGTLSNRFRDLYLSGSTLYIGNIKLTDSNGALAFRDSSGNSVDVSTIDSAYVQLRQDYAYASLTGVPTNVSQFANDAGYLTAANTLDSAEASAIILEDVDSAYVQARQITYDFLDSAEVIALIDSTYVQARQITYDFLDSAEAINLIDSSYVQLRQDYAYASLTGAPTNVSAFTNDANYLDSNTSQAVINTNFAAKTTDDLTEGSTNQYYLKARVDSDIAASLNDSGNTVTVTINNTIEDKVDSAYVLDRVAEAPFLDSADAINLIDSAYVQLRQDYAYSSLTGKPNQGLNTTDSVTFSGLTVSGNLIVSGTQSVINTEIFKVIDPLIHLGDSNINSDIVDIGFIGKYYADGQERHTGLVRDANNGEYYLYTNSVDSASDSVNQINLSAPGFTLATLNTGNITGQYQGFDSDFGTKTTSNLTEGSNLYYTDARVTAHVDAAYVQALQTPQDFAYASLTGAPTNVSQFANDAGYLTSATVGGLDSADVSAIITNDVDAAYVQSRQITYNTSDFVDSAYVSTQIGNIYIPSLGNDYLDSNTVTGVIDATYIQSNQTPQDFAYGSLTGVPTTVSTFTNDANYLDSNTVTGVINAAYIQSNQTAQDFSYASLTGKPNILDSADVSSIITADVDATFVQALQDYAYSSLTGTPNVLDSSHVIAIHNSLGGVDSGAIIALIDSAYVQARQIDLQRDSGFVTNIIDSAYIAARTSAGTDSATVVSIINSTVDSAYVQLRQSLVGGAGTDSATVSAIILADVDSAYVQARQLNEVAAPLTQVSYEFTATAGQSSFTGLDIDSGKFQTYLNGSLLAASDYTFNSTKVDLVVAADSGDILNVIKFSGNDTGATAIQQRHYIYTATSGQTIFTGSDDNSATLSYTQGRINVYLNGLLLIDSADYTENAAGDTVTFTSGVTAGHIVNIQTLTGNTGSFAPLSQTLYEYTADSGQTVFTGVDDNAATLDFSNDKVVVYLNGILLTSTDYTLSGGNTVTLDTAADSGNHLTVAKLSGNNIGIDSGEVRNLIDSAYISALGFGTGDGGGVDSAAIINLIDSAYVQARTTAGTDSATVVSIVNEYIDQTATSLTTTTVDQVVDTFAAATYRTAKYIVQMSHTSGYHSSEILLVHDGSTVYMTTYADIITNASLGTIDGDINAGNVRLLVSPVNTNTNINVTRINVDV
jgi:hypothetical protein